MIGFRPNGAPQDKSEEVNSAPVDEENEVDFERLWDHLLDLSSAEVRDAYERYDQRRRR